MAEKDLTPILLGIVAQSKVWALELGRFGIRSMAIAPGAIDTTLPRSMPAEILAQMAKEIPVQRIGDVDNIAKRFSTSSKMTTCQAI